MESAVRTPIRPGAPARTAHGGGRRTLPLLGAAEPYALPALLVLTTVVGLVGDSVAHDLATQRRLGVLTFAVLGVAAWSMPRHRRNQILLLVLVSVAVELFGSVIWGAYRYRFHNVPLYVPPGHGIVYLFSLRMAATPWFERHRRGVIGTALVAATGWMLAGLLVWPHISGRLDVLGALCWPLFVAFALLTNRGLLFAAAFFATSGLEVLGTSAGDWTWVASTPVVHIATGNPPSVIAGLYCLLDASVLGISHALLRLAPVARDARLVRSAPRRLSRAPASGRPRSGLPRYPPQ